MVFEFGGIVLILSAITVNVGPQQSMLILLHVIYIDLIRSPILRLIYYLLISSKDFALSIESVEKLGEILQDSFASITFTDLLAVTLSAF